MAQEAGLAQFNALSGAATRRLLFDICQAPTWYFHVAEGRPYPDLAALFQSSDEALDEALDIELEEALSNHPRIGDRAAGPRSSREQSLVVKNASPEILEELNKANQEYEDRFSYLYLVCADGRSAEDLLGGLKERLSNDAETEHTIMRIELAKINRLRLSRLLAEELASHEEVTV